MRIFPIGRETPEGKINRAGRENCQSKETRDLNYNKHGTNMDDDLYESCLEEVLAALKNKGFSFILKREQDSALRHLFKRKDVVAVLPTGFGKSLIFQLLVFLAKAKGRREGGEGFAAILVITPLTSIIQDQISEISSMGLSGCNLSEKLE